MWRVLLLVLLTVSAVVVVLGQPDARTKTYKGPIHLASLCRGADLSMRQVYDNAAMGGQHLTLYALRNNSSTPCTLKGYPRYELLNKSAAVRPRGRAINSKRLPGDEALMPAQLVTVAPGTEAWFLVHYNSGGAGYLGKPCPRSRKVRIVAPGTTRAFVLKDDISSCRTVEVSAVRGGPVPE